MSRVISTGFHHQVRYDKHDFNSNFVKQPLFMLTNGWRKTVQDSLTGGVSSIIS